MVKNRRSLSFAYMVQIYRKLQTTLDYHYDDQLKTYPGPNDQRPELNFEYRITNPWRAVGSLGSVYALGDIKGFINADIEFIDYGSAEYNGTALQTTLEK
ncbi:MAG: hypothetical protein IPN79_16175 [Saprospiraceae bacterium]|nr:hypothetical protein [Saprospiraceae bacterium]